MTLPANVPKYRRPPDTERFITGAKPTQIIKRDEHSLKRNAEQIVFQTSGEIGVHYYGFETEAYKLNKQPLRNTSKASLFKTNFQPENNPSNTINSYRDPLESSRSPQLSKRSDYSDPFVSARDSYRENSTNENKYIYTLKHLDKSFDRKTRRDLVIASLPSKPNQELIWCASSINKSAQQSKNWTEKLRRDSN